MKRIAALILLASLTANALAFEPFVVSDIRIDGLSRISAGTVLNYLPVNKGDRLTTDAAQRAIRALYQTKFFSEVEIDREGDIMVIKVTERPSIAKLTLRGNKDIKEDDLRKGLKEIGLSEGETFDRLSLDRVQQELIRQYYNRGKYNVSVEPHVTNLDRNRVAIDIEIREGKVAKIKEINIVGNKAFTDKEIRKDFESDTTNWMSWYSKDDQYSREKLSGDLEKLQSYYMDRGYADFGVDSTQVSIAPDKREMYIAAAVKEGEIYTVSDIHLLGDLVLPEETLRQLVFQKKDQTFNRKAIEASSDAIKSILASIGYAFAKVTPVPKLDKDKRTVDLTFYIEPGKRVYVRRVVFNGNTRTEDDVMRREMRQLEGSWYSQPAIDRSKIRLQHLGYFKKVDIDKKLVPGTEDQVDLTVKVEEQSAGSLMFGVGYSQYSGIILSASVSQNNFLGTGDSFSVSAQRSDYVTSVSATYFNPYLTDNGIGIGYNAAYSKSDYGDANSDFVNFTSSQKSFSAFLNIPITDFDSLRAGLGLSSNKINLDYQTYDSTGQIVTQSLSPQQLIDYQNAIGHKTIHSWTGQLGWTHDTRNGYWAPTRGGMMTLSTDIALPGSTVQYYKIFGEANHYWPIGGGFVLYLDGQVGYGKTYGQEYDNSFGDYVKGQKIDFPFWENYYSGGVRDVRGFQDNTLGPKLCVGTDASGKPLQADKDGRCNGGYYTYAQPVGGAFKVLGTAQVFIPLPFLKDVNTARVSWFVDVGNVYKDYSAFKASELRASTGISLQWQAPIGPLIINFATPIRSKKEDRHYEERIQFTFGSQF
ncbi:outer membrane protein insertion porin family [Dyella sp. SG562]|jgi:outer membrane protein insertion porin family|uniref:outer membrane protein assembly factor BamA n=1 Tax=Dyella TaxID=231454 RepID=UPI0014232AAC|nr:MULTISPECIES: outer membrane protein assembly factor BamA [unclassified Dyella]NII75504.1 outer membrane protein insertion porin family [Dyella sp. SG562]NKJ23624.1 outer membrane protein insertion porin family [Dyella sp. SG609]